MSPEVRHLAAVEGRVETGAVQFGDDWPGLFIRGDDAYYLATVIKTLLGPKPLGEMETHYRSVLDGYANEILKHVVLARLCEPKEGS